MQYFCLNFFIEETQPCQTLPCTFAPPFPIPKFCIRHCLLVTGVLQKNFVLVTLQIDCLIDIFSDEWLFARN